MSVSAVLLVQLKASLVLSKASMPEDQTEEDPSDATGHTFDTSTLKLCILYSTCFLFEDAKRCMSFHRFEPKEVIKLLVMCMSHSVKE